MDEWKPLLVCLVVEVRRGDLWHRVPLQVGWGGHLPAAAIHWQLDSLTVPRPASDTARHHQNLHRQIILANWFTILQLKLWRNVGRGNYVMDPEYSKTFPVKCRENFFFTDIFTALMAKKGFHKSKLCWWAFLGSKELPISTFYHFWMCAMIYWKAFLHIRPKLFEYLKSDNGNIILQFLQTG